MEKPNKNVAILAFMGIMVSLSCTTTGSDEQQKDMNAHQKMLPVRENMVKSELKDSLNETVAFRNFPENTKQNNAIAKKQYVSEDAKPEEMISHKIWHDLLKQYVDAQGNVNYKGLHREQAKVEEYTQYLKENWPKEDWPKKDQLAYWINLYNASTIELILKHYPVKSIKDIPTPWDTKFIEIKGKKHSLNEIENSIIRPTFKEPKIHFAVNCAAFSCPKLLNEAYHPAVLDHQLTKQTTYFINNPKKNKIDPNHVEISKIFEWYKEDFNNYASIVDFLNLYSKIKINANAKVDYMEYNWELNGLNN